MTWIRRHGVRLRAWVDRRTVRTWTAVVVGLLVLAIFTFEPSTHLTVAEAHLTIIFQGGALYAAVRRTQSKVLDVHEKVNGRLDRALAEIAELKARLSEGET